MRSTLTHSRDVSRGMTTEPEDDNPAERVYQRIAAVLFALAMVTFSFLSLLMLNDRDVAVATERLQLASVAHYEYPPYVGEENEDEGDDVATLGDSVMNAPLPDIDAIHNNITVVEKTTGPDGESLIEEEPIASGPTIAPFSVLVCTSRESAEEIAGTIASVGTDTTRYSVAYDAFLNSTSCDVGDNVVLLDPILRIPSSEGAEILIAPLDRCDECLMEDEKVSYAVLVPYQVFDTIFQCERDYRFYDEEGYDTSLKCRRDT